MADQKKAAVKLYLSGPISGIVDQNEAHFLEADKWLSQYFTVVNPKKLSACPDMRCDSPDPRFPGDHAWECWLRHDLKAMLDCDGVALLAGYQSSRGARLEVSVARSLGMKSRMWWVWMPEKAQRNGFQLAAQFIRDPQREVDVTSRL